MIPRHGGFIPALLILATVSPARGEVIRIWPTAVVGGDQVRLADVADFQGFESDRQAALRDCIVHVAPRQGTTIAVGVEDVREALVESGANLATIHLSGSTRCKVTRLREDEAGGGRRGGKGRIENGRRSSSGSSGGGASASDGSTDSGSALSAPAPAKGTLAALLRGYIEARLGEVEGRLEVRFDPASYQRLQASAQGYTVHIRPSSDRVLGVMGFELELARPGAAPRVEPVVAEVWLVRKVVAARRAINRGSLIAGRDLMREERRCDALSDDLVLDPVEAIGRQAGRFIPEGEALHAEWLADQPLVKRGDVVTIWVQSGGFELKTTGRAQGAGALGDRVVVRRDGTRKKQDLIEGIVTGPRTIAVRETLRLAGP